jgi:hypothetical protein
MLFGGDKYFNKVIPLLRMKHYPNSRLVLEVKAASKAVPRRGLQFVACQE